MISYLRVLASAPRQWMGLLARRSPIVVGSVLLMGLLLVGMAALDVYLLDQRIQNSLQTARTLSQFVATETDRSLQSVSTTLDRVVERVRHHGASSASAFKAAVAEDDVQSLLRDSPYENPFVDSLFVASADGEIIDRESGADVSVANLLGGHAFLNQMKEAPANKDIVSPPFRSTLSGTWQISISRRISGPDGAFVGVVSGAVKLASFARILNEIPLGKQASVSIFHEGGEIIACFPQQEITLGADKRDGELYSRFIAPKVDGVTQQVSSADGVRRVLAVINSSSFPVATVVGAAINDVVAGWVVDARNIALAVAGLMLVIVVVAASLALSMESGEKARQMAAVRAAVAVEQRRFEDAIENVVEGVAIYDADDRMIACNRRFTEISGISLSGQALRAGAMGDRAMHKFGREIEKPAHVPGGPFLVYRELKDGRVIAQRERRLSDRGWVATYEDVTAQRRATEKAQELATNDQLTGLANRAQLMQLLDRAFEESRFGGTRFALLQVDIERFNEINERFGYVVGDALLQELAKRLKGAVRRGTAVARLGGDELAILAPVVNMPNDAAALAERLHAVATKPYIIGDNAISINVHFGVAFVPGECSDSGALLHSCEQALELAKREGSRYHFFLARRAPAETPMLRAIA